MPLLTGRRLAALIALGVVLVIVAAIAAASLRGGGGGSALDSGLRRSGDRAAALLDHPKLALPIPDQSFRSFQAWYYDLQGTYSRARKLMAAGQFLQVQVVDRDAFPPQVLELFTPGGAFVVLDATTVNNVLTGHQAAFTSVSVGTRTYRVYVAPIVVPANLRPANVAGYFAVLQPSS